MTNQNYFKQEYEEFLASTFYGKLNKKFTPLPYCKKYKLLKNIVLVASYIFNLLSGITASSLLYFFVLGLTKSQIAFAITLVIIALLELLKRNLSGLTFKDYLMYKKIPLLLVVTLITLSVLSILSSYFGSKELVFNLSTPALVSSVEDATSSLDAQIKSINQQIKDARETRWSGTTTSASQKTITSLNKQKEALLKEVIRVREKVDTDNDEIETQHLRKLTINANHFALITLLLELLFLSSTFYLQYYDFRSFIEFNQVERPVATNKNNDYLLPEEKTVATDSQNISMPIDILQGAIKNAKSNLSAYQSKLKNGQGTVSANQKGINRWKKRLKELEELLPDKPLDTEDESITDKGSDNGVATLF